MIKYLRSEKGASSILVAMVLIILLVFAALSISTSMANLKLSQKYAQTASVYYSLDSEGERVLYEVKKQVYESGLKAQEDLKAIVEGSGDKPELPDEVWAELQNTLSSDATRGQERAYAVLAIYYARTALEQQFPGCTHDVEEPLDLSSEEESDPNPGFLMQRTIILEVEGNHRYLNIAIKVSEPRPDKSPDEICTIEEWRFWQEPFEYKNKVDLWEGKP